MHLCAAKLRKKQANPCCPWSTRSHYRPNSGDPMSDFPRTVSLHNSGGHHLHTFWSCAINVAALSSNKALIHLFGTVQGRPMKFAGQQTPSWGHRGQESLLTATLIPEQVLLAPLLQCSPMLHTHTHTHTLYLRNL